MAHRKHGCVRTACYICRCPSRRYNSSVQLGGFEHNFPISSCDSVCSDLRTTWSAVALPDWVLTSSCLAQDVVGAVGFAFRLTFGSEGTNMAQNVMVSSGRDGNLRLWSYRPGRLRLIDSQASEGSEVKGHLVRRCKLGKLFVAVSAVGHEFPHVGIDRWTCMQAGQDAWNSMKRLALWLALGMMELLGCKAP